MHHAQWCRSLKGEKISPFFQSFVPPVNSSCSMQTVAVPPCPMQVHQFDFCAAGGASGEANNEAVLNLAGVRPGHLLMAEWHNSVGRPCHYVAADLANGCLVLAIRSGAVPAHGFTVRKP